MAKTYTEQQLKDFEHRAETYPNVAGPDVFKRSYLLGVDRGRKTQQSYDLAPETITVHREKWREGDAQKGYEPLFDADGSSYRGIRLAGAAAPVPAYRVSALDSAGRVRTLRNRVAIVGYGSNSSETVLAKKFNVQVRDAFYRAACGQNRKMHNRLTMAVLSAAIEDHVIAAGAFAGAIGSNPATILHSPGTDSTVTVGFFDKAAAEQMVTTEPNYDATALRAGITLSNGMQIGMAIVWNSPWGARQDPQNPGKPLAYAEIPSTTALRKVNGREALDGIISEGTGVDVPAMEKSGDTAGASRARRNFIRMCIQGEEGVLGTGSGDDGQEFRLGIISRLQQNRIAPNIQGVQLLPAAFATPARVAAARHDVGAAKPARGFLFYVPGQTRRS